MSRLSKDRHSLDYLKIDTVSYKAFLLYSKPPNRKKKKIKACVVLVGWGCVCEEAYM